MAASESLRFDIIGQDHASAAFTRAGESVKSMGDKITAATTKAAFLDDALKRQAVTARRSTDATLALAKSDEILAEVERRLRDGALEAEFALKKEADALREAKREADRLDGKHVRVKIDVDRSAWSRIGGLFGGGGGGAAGGGGLLSALPAASGLVNPYTIGAGVLASPFAAQLVSGATVFGLGSGLAGLGIAGAFGTGKTVTAGQLRAAQLRLEAAQAAVAKKNTPSAQAALVAAQQNLAQLQDSAQTPAQAQMRKSFQNLSQDAQDSLAKIGKSFVPVMQSVFNTADSTLKKLTPVFAGAEKVIAGPFKIFADTIIKSFDQPAVKSSIDAVAKSFALLLKALTPQIGGDVAQVADGISRIARSVADHPQAFADFVKGFFKLAGIALDGISALANFGGYLQQHFWPAMHRTAVIFDGVRHEIAHVWDQIFENSIGTVIRLGHNVETQFNSLRHGTAVVFDGVRHDIAHYWDMTWNNTVGRVQRGVADVAAWARKLPGQVEGAFKGAGRWLLAAGKDVIQGFWDGLTFIWHKVTGWISGLASWIVKHKGPVSLDRTLLYPAGRALMEGLKVGLLHGFVDIKSIVTGAASDIGKLFGAGFKYAGAPDVTGWLTGALTMDRLPLSWMPALQVLVSKESGGNPNAVNPVAVLGQHATGLLQMLPSTYAAFGGPPGGILNPVLNAAAALRYIAARYGSPSNIPGLFSGTYVGYAGGTMSAAPGWAWVGERGPELMHFRGGEQVLPASAVPGGGDVHYHVTVNVPPTVNPREAGREVAQLILAHTKNGGRLYPAGTVPK